MHSTMAHHPLTDAPLDPEQQSRQLSLSLGIELDTIWYGISLDNGASCPSSAPIPASLLVG